MIKFENVSYSYENGKSVLEDISFSIENSEFVGIVGQNGTGKTTLIKLILELVKPKSGKITNTFKKRSYISQVNNSSDYSFVGNVEEIVSLGLKFKMFSFINKKDKIKIDQVLDKFGLLPYKKHKLNELSGGQMQKVRLCKVILESPEVLVLDEPTTGIDASSREILLETLHELNTQNKMTIILISHIYDDLKYASKILEVKDTSIKIHDHTHSHHFHNHENDVENDENIFPLCSCTEHCCDCNHEDHEHHENEKKEDK